MPKGQVSGAQVISKACRLLRTFDSGNSKSLAELSKQTHLHPTTAYRILQALVYEGLIFQDPESDKYSLGYGLVILGEIAKQGNYLLNIALPHVKKLADQWGETTVVDVLNRNLEVTSVLHIPASYQLSTSPRYDQPVPSHCTAAGKVLLAHADSKTIQKFVSQELKRYTPATIVDAQILLEEFEKIREQGYATNLEEQEIGLNAVGVPIRDSRCRVIAVLSLGGPTSRLSLERIPELAAGIMKVANEISQELGCKEPA